MAQIGRSRKNNENNSRNEKHSSSINNHQRRVPKEPVINLDRFAGSSDDEAAAPPKKQKQNHRSNGDKERKQITLPSDTTDNNSRSKPIAASKTTETPIERSNRSSTMTAKKKTIQKDIPESSNTTSRAKTTTTQNKRSSDSDSDSDTSSSPPPVVIHGRRAAKRARKELALQKAKERQQLYQKEKEEKAEKEGKTVSVIQKKGTITSSPSEGWQLPGGVIATDIQVGTGKPAKKGCTVAITYVGSFPDLNDKVFDENSNTSRPLTFKLEGGNGSDVVEGLEIGVGGMRVGGRRSITIPSEMGYGEKGRGPDIPGGVTLQFQVHLLSFEKKISK